MAQNQPPQQRTLKIAVTIVESLAKAGGYEIFTFNLLKELGRMGHSVTLYAPRKRLRQDSAILSNLAVNVRPLPPQAVSLSKHFPALLALFMRLEQRVQGYDVWQVMGAYPEANLVRGLEGLVPLALRAHGDDVQCAPELGYGMRQNPALDAAIRRNLSMMDMVVALTPGLREGFLELGVAPERIQVIPNGISLAQFEKQRDLHKVRASLGIGVDELVLLTVGRNHPKKGYDLIPEMARLLKEAGKRFTWLVVGKDSDALTPELATRGLEGIVRPLPSIGVSNAAKAIDNIPSDELVDLYRTADIFVFPSRLETFGRVILEAMAAGTPVVTTDALGCRDVAGMGAYARMLPVDDAGGMVAAISSLMDSPEERQELASQGLVQAQRHDWHEVVGHYVSSYDQLLKSHAKKH